MASSSSAQLSGPQVLREDSVVALRPLATPELRGGDWTRFGSDAVLGDAVTENALAGLAESTRAAAQAQGYAIGWGEGRRAAAALAAETEAELLAAHQANEERRDAEHRAAVAGLARAAEQFQLLAAQVAGAVQDQALTLARELVTELVGHELRIAPDLDADIVERAIAVLPHGVPATVRLHPAALGSTAVDQLAAHGVVVVPDPALQRADALVETEQNVVDLRVSAALARVREVLA